MKVKVEVRTLLSSLEISAAAQPATSQRKHVSDESMKHNKLLVVRLFR